MRVLFLTFLLAPFSFCADDAAGLLQSCAYITALPTKSNAPKRPTNTAGGAPEPSASKAPVEFRIESLGEPPISYAPDHLFASGDKIRLTVSAEFEGYFYLFQDDPQDRRVLVFPERPADANHLTKAGRLTIPLHFTSAHPFTLLMTFPGTPIADAARMSADDLRQYMKLRRNCWGPVFQETTVNFRRESYRRQFPSSRAMIPMQGGSSWIFLRPLF